MLWKCTIDIYNELLISTLLLISEVIAFLLLTYPFLRYCRIYVWAVEHVNGGFKTGLSAYHTHYTEIKMGKALKRFKHQRSSSCKLI